MRTLFHPAMLHSPTGDPGLWVDLPDEGRAVLLDLPSIAHLPPRKLSRLSHVMVTHTHRDHFVGFDQLLRAALRREVPLAITGPPGFLASVRGRIGAAANTDKLIVEGPGQVIAFLTDLVGTDENLRRAEEFVRDADRALALERKHLTARQAGELARRAGAPVLEMR